MVSQLLPVEEAEHDEWLEKVTENIQKQSLVSPVLETQHIELAIQVTFFVYLFVFLQDDIILLHVEVLLFYYTFAGLH
jgi:hypothetical protein